MNNMKTEQIKDEINRLDVSEKILLVEDIRDSIASYEDRIPMPTWKKQELDKYKSGDLEVHDWSGVHKNLRDQYK